MIDIHKYFSVWGTLSGWTQSWIVAGQVLNAINQSYWNLTKGSAISKEMPSVLKTLELE